MSAEDNRENLSQKDGVEGPNPQIEISANEAVGFIAAAVQSGNRQGLG